jgi:MFS family permease
MSPYFNAAVLSQSNKTSPEIVSYSVAILQAGSFVGRIGAGRLADRFGVWLVFGAIPFLTSVTLFAFWVGPVGTAPTIIGLVLYGAFSGGWFTLAAAATAAISPIEEIGSRIGMMWNGIAIPMLIGPIVTGSE